MANKIQIKRGIKSKIPVLNIGEFGLCTDTNELYIGNDGNVKIPTVSQNVIYFDKYKPLLTVNQKFIDIFSNYTNPIIIINKDITLTSTVEIPDDVTIISENKSKVIGGDFDSFKIWGTNVKSVDVSSISGNILTMSSVTDFNTGDYVRLQARTNAVYGLHTIIKNIDTINKKITLLTNDYKIDGTTFKLIKINPSNILIEGLTFEKSVPTSNKDIRISDGVNVTVINNNFENSEGILAERSFYCNIEHNNFSNTGDSCFMYDVDYIRIRNNFYDKIQHGIRCAYVNGCLIEGNNLTSGKDSNYSVGIEITSGTDLSHDKSCYNKIIKNYVANMNVGVKGSANGGIHLNFNSRNNLVDSNTCLYNGIGIYLENYCKNNTISNNTSSYNYGYYGVGIEVDWNGDNNTIIGNTCEYNSGSIEADESCGIEIRSNRTDTEHLIINSIVTNNKCRYNGKSGIHLGGNNTICSNNICENNGTNLSFSETSDILIVGGEGVLLSQNTIQSSTSKATLRIKESNKVFVKNNNIIGKGSTVNILLLVESDNVYLTYNNFSGSSTERRIVFYGSDDLKIKNIQLISNLIDCPTNGYPVLEFNNVDTYRSKYNMFLADNKVVTWQCANELTD